MTDTYIINSTVYINNVPEKRTQRNDCYYKTGPSGFTRSFDGATNSTSKLVQKVFLILTSVLAIAVLAHRLTAVSARGSARLLNGDMPGYTTRTANHAQDLSIRIVGSATGGFLVGCGLRTLKYLFCSEPVTMPDKCFYNYILGVLVGVMWSTYIAGLDETLE